MAKSVEVTLEEFFAGYENSRALFDAAAAHISALGGVTMRVTKSQAAFRRVKNFAWLWLPGKYLRGATAPLVLTLCFRTRLDSPRWKEINEPYLGRVLHHLQIYQEEQIDTEVTAWLREAWENAT